MTGFALNPRARRAKLWTTEAETKMSSIDQALRSAKSLSKARQFDAARAQILAALVRFPGNQRALIQLQELTEAVTGLRAKPLAAQHIQRVLAIRDARGPAAAIPEMLAFCLLNPTNPVAQNITGALHLDAGDAVGALPYFLAAQKIDPSAPEVAANLARAQEAAGMAEAALATLQAMTTRHPGFAPGLLALAQAQSKRGDHLAAIAAFRAYLALMPKDAEVRINLGNALSASGDTRAAAEAFREVLTLDPENFRAMTNLGNMLLAQGENDAAMVQFERALALNPQRGTTYFNMARGMKFAADSPHLAAMQTIAADAAQPEAERMQIEFALAKAYEDLKDADQSFAHLTRANGLRRKQVRYDLAKDRALFAQIKTWFAADALPDLPPQPRPTRLPILVLGMMRSGTTLTEQIISNHSMVYGGGELEGLNHLMDRVMLRESAPDAGTLQEIRAGYLAHIAAQPGDQPYVLDKMPFNFRWIGALRKALPEAPILHMRRNPMAVCWSIYKTFFTSTDIGFAYDMKELCGYYDLYAEMMGYWRDQYPSGFLDVDYAMLTESPETEIRRLIGFCGLPWEDACLAPETNARAVRTASQQQVRSGIYTGSTEQWRRYETHLGPMIAHFADRPMG